MAEAIGPPPFFVWFAEIPSTLTFVLPYEAYPGICLTRSFSLDLFSNIIGRTGDSLSRDGQDTE
jgi:hypothetical protein